MIGTSSSPPPPLPPPPTPPPPPPSTPREKREATPQKESIPVSVAVGNDKVEPIVENGAVESDEAAAIIRRLSREVPHLLYL